MHVNQYEEMFAIAPPVPHNQSAADTSPWAVIQYVPTLGTGGTSATVRVGTNTLIFKVNGATPSGDDAIGTDGVIDGTAAAYDTMGEAGDYVNGTRAWRMYLVGALRSDKVSRLLVQAATRCEGANGATIYGDTATGGKDNFVSIAISGEKFVNNGKGGHVTDWDSQCVNALTFAAVKLSAALTSAAMNFVVYQGKQGSAEEAIFSCALAEDTLKEFGEESPASPFVVSKPGYRLVVRVECASIFDAYTKFQVLGKTAVLDGSRVVYEDNY